MLDPCAMSCALGSRLPFRMAYSSSIEEVDHSCACTSGSTNSVEATCPALVNACRVQSGERDPSEFGSCCPTTETICFPPACILCHHGKAIRAGKYVVPTAWKSEVPPCLNSEIGSTTLAQQRYLSRFEWYFMWQVVLPFFGTPGQNRM